MLNTIN